MLKHTCASFFALLLIGCGHAPTSSPPATSHSTATSTSNDYGNPASWLCRPGRDDACAADQTTTVVAANGVTTRETWRANPDAPIDCFYVYPTVSRDPTPNSDMQAGEEERNAARVQFARFGSLCRGFAPIYRQVTLAGLRGRIAGQNPANWSLAVKDVSDAWNHYLKHDNNGRGVVLIGHSQGARVLADVLRNEIEGKPAHAQIVSALLLGTNIMVPKGKDVGGTLQRTPLCNSATQTGCVIAYVSFRDSSPPPERSLFGLTRGDQTVACTNPAELDGAKGRLHAYFPAERNLLGRTEPHTWLPAGKAIDTPFVSVPGLVTARCVMDQRSTHLSVTVHGNPDDPRADDIPGDLSLAPGAAPIREWGLHLIDANLAMGNLLGIVERQTRAYLGRK